MRAWIVFEQKRPHDHILIRCGDLPDGEINDSSAMMLLWREKLVQEAELAEQVTFRFEDGTGYIWKSRNKPTPEYVPACPCGMKCLYHNMEDQSVVLKGE